MMDDTVIFFSRCEQVLTQVLAALAHQNSRFSNYQIETSTLSGGMKLLSASFKSSEGYELLVFQLLSRKTEPKVSIRLLSSQSPPLILEKIALETSNEDLEDKFQQHLESKLFAEKMRGLVLQ